MFIVVLLFAAVVAGVLSLPSDWVRRRFPDPVRGVGELAGVIVLVGIGACFANLGLVDGLPSVLSLIALLPSTATCSTSGFSATCTWMPVSSRRIFTSLMHGG